MNKHISFKSPNFKSKTVYHNIRRYCRLLLLLTVDIRSSAMPSSMRRLVYPVLQSFFSLVRADCVIIGLCVKPLSWVKNIDDRGYVTPVLDSEDSPSPSNCHFLPFCHSCARQVLVSTKMHLK